MKHRILLFLLLLALPLSVVAQGDITVPTKKKVEQKTESKKKPTPKPTTGTLVITSSPSGAVVKIDGDYMGETPLTLRQQKAGTYSITFSAEGYISSTQSAIVTAGKTITCSATLKKKQATKPTATVSTTNTTTPTTQPTTSYASSQTFTANGVSFKMIRVEGQGSPFYIGETEVTQALWQAVMGNNPSNFKGRNRPVEKVRWDDCKDFIRKLNSLTGKSFRLPKEKEWEYAAKGGSKSHGYKYSGSNTLEDVAWYDKNAYYCGSSSINSSHPDYGTHPVARKKANELGIYDMTGNVMEWCEDLYDSSDFHHVLRGGSWGDEAGYCRVSIRSYDTPSYRNFYVGLRLAL